MFPCLPLLLELKVCTAAGWWWCIPLIPVQRRQRQVAEFEARLIYRVNSRTGTKATAKPCLQKTRNKNKKSSSFLSKKPRQHFMTTTKDYHKDVYYCVYISSLVGNLRIKE